MVQGIRQVWKFIRRRQSFMIRFILSAGLFFSVSISTAAFAPEAVLFIQPQDSVLARLYLAILDREMEPILSQIEDSLNLPSTHQFGRFDYVFPNAGADEVWTVVEDPAVITMLSSAQAAEALSYVYSQKNSKFYRFPSLLNTIERILIYFRKVQNPSGNFQTSATTRNAWNTAIILKSLIPAFAHVQQDISAEQKTQWLACINQALNYIQNQTHPESPSESLLRCAVLAMGYSLTGSQQYLAAANQAFAQVQGVFRDSGEIVEQTGPDLYHATIALEYAFLYRLCSGNTELDPILTRSLHWITRFYTFRTVPLEGISSRHWLHNGSIVCRLMGALSFYAREDEELAQLAIRYMETFSERKDMKAIFSCLFSFLKGSEFHRAPEVITPIPYKPYAQIYKNEHTLYFTVGKNYQTIIPLRSRLPLKGLQTWSYRGQPPLIFPSPSFPSQTLGYGFLSNEIDLSWISPPQYRHTSVIEAVDVLNVKQGELFSGFVFAPDTTVVVYKKPEEHGNVLWSAYQQQAASLRTVSEQQILFQNSDARILLPNLTPIPEHHSNTEILRFPVEGAFAWFTFAGKSSTAVVRPVLDGLVLVHVQEKQETFNILVNLSTRAFQEKTNFPNTRIPIPPVPALGAVIVE